MSFLFNGLKSLRPQYAEANFTQINAATDVSTALKLITATHQCKLALLLNGCSADVKIYLSNPDAGELMNDPGVGNTYPYRLFFLEVGAKTPLNFDISGTIGLSLDAGTTVWLVKGTGTAVSGEKFRAIAWG